jgi:hypothetical protein
MGRQRGTSPFGGRGGPKLVHPYDPWDSTTIKGGDSMDLPFVPVFGGS